jgi:nucleoside-diphosphate-sugar epimerase
MDSNGIVKNDLNYIMGSIGVELNKLEGKDILITGGAGFLGFYLIQSLIYWNDCNKDKDPISVWIYDNFIRGKPSWIPILEKRKDIHIGLYDVSAPFQKSNAQYSHIIHAASIASPTYYRLHPIETMDANVQGLRNLLEYALRQREKGSPLEGFLFFSSSEIYGDPVSEAIPTSEDYRGNVSCTGPRACYDESKRYGETLCVNFAEYYGLPIKIVRPFNNYGPGLKISDKRVIPDFARSIFSDEDIVILSNGSPTRTFCYVADAIIGYFKILISGESGEAYNIGVEEPEISIRQLAEIIVDIGRKHFKYGGKIIYKDSNDPNYLIDSPNRRCPCISKAKKYLGYSPSIELYEGLLRTMCWYSENLEGENK